jgi:hypothetical protein
MRANYTLARECWPRQLGRSHELLEEGAVIYDLDALPLLFDMGSDAGAATYYGGITLMVCALALFAWRQISGVQVRRRSDPANPAHLPPLAQRIGDWILPLSLALMGFGLADADWGWAGIAFGIILAWVGATLAFGLGKEHAEPDLPATTTSLLSSEAAEKTDTP